MNILKAFAFNWVNYAIILRLPHSRPFQLTSVDFVFAAYLAVMVYYGLKKGQK